MLPILLKFNRALIPLGGGGGGGGARQGQIADGIKILFILLNVFVKFITLSPPTSEAGVRSPARPQVGKLVVACRWSAVHSTEP